MNFALFAGGQVGLELATFLGEQDQQLACLVVDAKAQSDFVEKIISVSKVAPDRVFDSTALGKSDTLTILEGLDIDIIILAWWPYLLKKPLIDIPRLGCLNLHPSYLPYNRGKHYNFWTIVEGSPFGVTLHMIGEGIDTGALVFQRRIEKTWEDTGKTLYEKAQAEIVRLFRDKFDDLAAGRYSLEEQKPNEGSFRLAKELDPASEIHLEQECKARDLLNLLRARTFEPHPGAWFLDEGVKYEVRIQISRVPDERASP